MCLHLFIKDLRLYCLRMKRPSLFWSKQAYDHGEFWELSFQPESNMSVQDVVIDEIYHACAGHYVP